MKFNCEKYALQAAVATASRAAASKSPIEALEGLKLEAEDGSLRVTGYDLRRGIYTSCECEVSEAGSLVMNARLLGEMVRRMPDGIIYVETNSDMTVNIKCGKSEFSVLSMKSDDYPELPSVDAEHRYTIKQSALKSMINECSFAAATTDARPIYTGALFDIENKRLTMVCVDGFRLAIRREDVDDHAPEGVVKPQHKFVVPCTALSDVERMCESEGDETAEISVGSSHVSLKVGESVVVSRLLTGDFLDYNRAMPDTFTKIIKVNRAELTRVIDRVSLIIDEKTKHPVRMTFNDGTISCVCNTPLGTADDMCLCDGNGEELMIGFNGRYMLDALKAAHDEELNLCLNNSTTPCIMTPCDGSDSFKYMVLPIRLRQ